MDKQWKGIGTDWIGIGTSFVDEDIASRYSKPWPTMLYSISWVNLSCM